MNEQPPKDRFYFKLFEALDAPGCPICTIVLRDSRAYLDSVFYERITDVPTRMGLRDSFGLCNLHTWLLRDLPGSSAPDLGFAIVAGDLLSRFQRMAAEPRVAGWRVPWGWLARAGSGLRARLKRTACPACVVAGRSETVHLQQLLDLLGDEAFSEKYCNSTGICIPHFLVAQEAHALHEHLPKLREFQIHAAQSLRATLDRFAEKHDHRTRDKITPAEATAWIEAIELLAGKRGVFDGDVPRRCLSRLRDPHDR